MSYFKDKETLVQSVTEMLGRLKPGSRLTMTIIQGQFEDFSARIAIEGSSVDTAKSSVQTFFDKLTNTSPKTTPDG